MSKKYTLFSVSSFKEEEYDTYEEYTQAYNERSVYMKTQSKHGDWVGKCKESDLPSAHPHWAELNRLDRVERDKEKVTKIKPWQKPKHSSNLINVTLKSGITIQCENDRYPELELKPEDVDYIKVHEFTEIRLVIGYGIVSALKVVLYQSGPGIIWKTIDDEFIGKPGIGLKSFAHVWYENIPSMDQIDPRYYAPDGRRWEDPWNKENH